MNLSFRMQQALTDRKINSLPDKLPHILFRTAEAMQNPRLTGFVPLPQGDDFVMAAYIVQDHWLLQGFREFDLPLKEFDLSFKTRLVHFVQACLAEGYNLWLLQVLFQFFQGFINLKISIIQCPRMNAVTMIALIGTRLVQVQIDNLD